MGRGREYNTKGARAYWFSVIGNAACAGVIYGVLWLVKIWWVGDVLTRGFGALYVPFLIAAVLTLVFHVIGSKGGIVGFLCFLVGTLAALGVMIAAAIPVIAAATSTNVLEHDFAAATAMSVPSLLFFFYGDHAEKAGSDDESTDTGPILGPISAFALILIVFIIGNFLEPKIAYIVYLSVMGVLSLVLLAVWIPRFVKAGELPFSRALQYVEETEDSAGHHAKFPHGADIQTCARIVTKEIGSSHVGRNLGEFTFDWTTRVYGTTISVDLEFYQKGDNTVTASDYYRSRAKAYSRLRALTYECPFRVEWNVVDVKGNFPHRFDSSEW